MKVLSFSYKRFLLLVVVFVSIHLFGQQVNSLYYLENAPLRHKLNPAFQPTRNFYLSLPVLGYVQGELGNNSVTLKDLVYNYNGKTVSFLDEFGGNIDGVFNKIKSPLKLNTSLEINLLAFGFRYNDSYWNFSLSQKMDGHISVPKDAIKLGLYLTPDSISNNFELKNLQGNLTVYTEAALGYSEKINSKWTLGGKFKVLLGNYHCSNQNNAASLYAGIDKWNVSFDGVMRTSSPVLMKLSDDSKKILYSAPSTLSEWLKPSGLGAAIDAGAEYQLTPKLRLSGAILDLGFIRWKANTQQIGYKLNYDFDGVAHTDGKTPYQELIDQYTRLFTGNNLSDSLTTAIKNAYSLRNTSSGAFMTATTAKLNLGAEYLLLNNKMSLGLLSRTYLYSTSLSEELTASVNARPSEWLNASLSYSMIKGNLSSIGAAVGIRTGFVHWMLAGDYIPFERAPLYSSTTSTGKPSGTAIPIPYNVKTINLALGMSIEINSLIHNHKSTKKAVHKEEPALKEKTESAKVNRNTGLHKKKSSDCKCDN